MLCRYIDPVLSRCLFNVQIMISMLVITANMCWVRVGQGRAANIDMESPVSVTADRSQLAHEEPQSKHWR